MELTNTVVYFSIIVALSYDLVKFGIIFEIIYNYLKRISWMVYASFEVEDLVSRIIFWLVEWSQYESTLLQLYGFSWW